MDLIENFSVLISVYNKENPFSFDIAIKSIWTDATLKPSQVVLVKDGPLNSDLERIIKKWQSILSEKLTIVSLENNSGLATALNEGLSHCKFEIIARMDSDDLSLPNRFSLQYKYLEKNPHISVVSGKIEEWDKNLKNKISERSLPLTHQEILTFSKKRSPINHPAVMFRKTAVINSGGYPKIYPEDYPLWCKMLSHGYEFANLPETLVKMRTGDDFHKRRGNNFFQGEYILFKYLKSIGYINKKEFALNIAVRFITRSSPVFLKKIIYKHLR